MLTHIPSPVLLLLIFGLVYVFMRGVLGCTYDFANWAVKKLEGPEKSSRED